VSTKIKLRKEKWITQN